ncbi:17823_t:CDS:1, partial [Funneliformis geosporum]
SAALPKLEKLLFESQSLREISNTVACNIVIKMVKKLTITAEMK